MEGTVYILASCWWNGFGSITACKNVTLVKQLPFVLGRFPYSPQLFDKKNGRVDCRSGGTNTHTLSLYLSLIRHHWGVDATDEEELQKGAVVHPGVVIKPVIAPSDMLLSFGCRSIRVQQGWAALSQLVNTACQSQHNGSKLWNVNISQKYWKRRLVQWSDWFQKGN